MAWAGIFLALFILNRYQRNRESSWIGWLAWEAEAGLEDSTIWWEPAPVPASKPSFLEVLCSGFDAHGIRACVRSE